MGNIPYKPNLTYPSLKINSTHPSNKNQEWYEKESKLIYTIIINHPGGPHTNSIEIYTNDSIKWDFSIVNTFQVDSWRIVEVFPDKKITFIDGATDVTLDSNNPSALTKCPFIGEYRYALFPNPNTINTSTRPFYVNVKVKARSNIYCTVSRQGFQHGQITTHVNLPIIWTWRHIDRIAVAQVTFDLEHNLVSLIHKFEDIRFLESGEFRVKPLEYGIFTFICITENKQIIDICIVRVLTNTNSHVIEIQDSTITPVNSEVYCDTPVLFVWRNSNLLITNHEGTLISVSSDSRDGHCYRIFEKTGIQTFSTTSSGENFGNILISEPPIRHEVFYDEINGFSINFMQCNQGDILYLFNKSLDINSRGKCELTVKSDVNPVSKPDSKDTFELNYGLIRCYLNTGIFEYTFGEIGIHTFKLENQNHHHHLIVLAQSGHKYHKLGVIRNEFLPQVKEIEEDDYVIWEWSSWPQNIVQTIPTIFEGDLPNNLISGFNSGLIIPNSAFYKQFSTPGVYYYFSEAHEESTLGRILVWPKSKIHVIICTPEFILNPQCYVLARNDWIVWVSFEEEINLEVTDPKNIHNIIKISHNCFAMYIFSTTKKFNFLSINISLISTETETETESDAKKNNLFETYFGIVVDKSANQNLVVWPLAQDYCQMTIGVGETLEHWAGSGCVQTLTEISEFFDRVHQTSLPLTISCPVMTTYVSEGTIHLHCNDKKTLIVNICKSVHRSITPEMILPAWNELEIGQAVYFRLPDTLLPEQYQILFTLNGSRPFIGSLSLLRYSHSQGIYFSKVGLYSIRAIAIEAGKRESSVWSSDLICVTDYDSADRKKPKFTLKIFDWTTATVSWNYPQNTIFELFDQKIIYDSNEIPLINQNSCQIKKLNANKNVHIQLCLALKNKENPIFKIIDYSFKFPKLTETLGPIIAIEKNPSMNSALVRWSRHRNTIPPVIKYKVIVDGVSYTEFPAKYEPNLYEFGDETTCVVCLEDVDGGEKYTVMVNAICLVGNNIKELKSKPVTFRNILNVSMDSEDSNDTLTTFISEGSSQQSLFESNADTSELMSLIRQKTMMSSVEIDIPTLLLSQVDIYIDRHTKNTPAVYWFINEYDERDQANFHHYSLILKLNSEQIFETSDKSGILLLSDISSNIVHTLTCEILVYDAKLVIIRLKKEILFVKSDINYFPIELKMKAGNEGGNLDFTWNETNLEFDLKNLEFNFSKNVKEFIREIWSELNIFSTKVETILFQVRELDAKGNIIEIYTQSLQYDRNGEQNKEIIDSKLNPRICFDMDREILTLKQCKINRIYELFLSLLYKCANVEVKSNTLTIFPLETPKYYFVYENFAPPISNMPVLASVTSIGIYITWTPTEFLGKIDGYVVYIDGIIKSQILDSNTFEFYFKEPVLGATHLFSIRSITNHPCGNSHYNTYDCLQPISAYDLCQPGPHLSVEYINILTAPINIKLVPCPPSNMKIYWSLENTQPDCYTVQWRKFNSKSTWKVKRLFIKKPQKFCYKICGLKPWTLYEVKIGVTKKLSNHIHSIDSETISFLSPGQPKSIINVKNRVIWFDKIRCDWEFDQISSDKILPYNIWVFVYFENGIFFHFDRLKQNSLFYEISNLTKNTVYLYEFYTVPICLPLNTPTTIDTINAYDLKSRILLANHSCTKFKTQTLNIDTKIPLKVQSLKENTILLKWGIIEFPAELTLKSYSIEWNIADTLNLESKTENSENNSKIISKDCQEFTIYNLISGLMYNISLFATFTQSYPISTYNPPYTSKLIESDFRLPAYPTISDLFLSGFSQTWFSVTWNKSLPHRPQQEDISSNFIGYELYLNGDMHVVLDRLCNKYTICAHSNSIYSTELVSLGETCYTIKSETTSKFKERSVSKPLVVDFNCQFKKYFPSFSCQFVQISTSGANQMISISSLKGYISVTWEASCSHFDQIAGLVVKWLTFPDQISHDAQVHKQHTSFEIENPPIKSLFQIFMQVALINGEHISSPHIHCQIPGPPETPILFSTLNQSKKGVDLRWNEPIQYSDALIEGYQLYNDNIKIGPVLGSSTLKAFVPTRKNQVYIFYVLAFTRDSYNYQIQSNTITVGTADNRIGSKKSCLKADVKSITNQSIEIIWEYFHPSGRQPDHYIIIWSSVKCPAIKSSLLPHTVSRFSIRGCSPGTNHFIHVKAAGRSGRVTCLSPQLSVQTCAPPSTPVLNLISIASNEIKLQWKRSNQYGIAEVSSYQIIILVGDNFQEETISLNTMTTTYSHATISCHNYIFKIQAMTENPVGNSKWSLPLNVLTPGLKIPPLVQISSGQLNSICFKWNLLEQIGDCEPDKLHIYCLPLIDASLYKDPSEFVGVSSCIAHVDLPITRDSDQFNSLLAETSYALIMKATDKIGISYWSCLEIMKTAESLASPDVVFTNISLNKRKTYVKELLININERDGLCLKLHWQKNKIIDSRTPKGRNIDQEVGQLSNTLIELERNILDRLRYLEAHAGYVSIHLNWTEIQSSPEVDITGYRVLVNRKEYGRVPLGRVSTTVELKRKKSPQLLHITLQATTNHRIGFGLESNSFCLDWESDFSPFRFFCYSSKHSPGMDCSYLPTFQKECASFSIKSLKNLPHRGHFSNQLPPPKCQVWNLTRNKLDIFPLISHLGYASFILFGTQWCSASIQLAKYFDIFAWQNQERFKFTYVCIESGHSWKTPSDRNNMILDFQTSGISFSIDSPVEFICACSGEAHKHLVDEYSILGVPTMVIFYPSGALAWQGRCALSSYEEFQDFYIHTSNIILDTKCPETQCAYCNPKPPIKFAPSSKQSSIASTSRKTTPSTSFASFLTSSRPSTSQSKYNSSSSSVYRRQQSINEYSSPSLYTSSSKSLFK